MTTATDPVVTLPDAEPPDVAVIAQILAGQTGAVRAADAPVTTSGSTGPRGRSSATSRRRKT